MLYTLDRSLSSQYLFVVVPSTKGVKVCICDAEEYGLPSMSVKTTPKFENRQIDAVIKGLVPRLTATMDNVVGKRK